MQKRDAPVEIEGTWWVPERPDERLVGTATFDGASLRLRVAGSFSAFGFEGARAANVLVGQSENGARSFALHGCFAESERPGKESIFGGEYLFDEFCGTAPTLLDQPMFSSALLQLEGLECWFRMWPFESAPFNDDSGAVLLRRKPKKSGSVRLPDCSVALSDGIYASSVGHRDASFTAAAEFEITYPEPMSFERVADDCIRLQLLVSLLSNQVATHRRLIVCRPGTGQTVYPITVHYPSPYRWLASEQDLDNEIAAYDDIADVYPAVLSGWWSLSHDVRLPIQLLITTLGTPAMEADLLAVAQAMEAYHRGSQPGSYLPPGEYERVREALAAAIPVGIPQALRSSLESRIRFGNEFSLRTRLRSLLSDLDDRFKTVLLHDPAAFVDRFVSTRNALTHGLGSEVRDRAWQGAEMAYGTLRARWILVARMLQDLGLPPARVWDLAHKNARFRFLLVRQGG